MEQTKNRLFLLVPLCFAVLTLSCWLRSPKSESLAERRKLAHESTVHIHRRCDEEECEQHERYVGSGGGVEYRHSVLSAFY